MQSSPATSSEYQHLVVVHFTPPHSSSISPTPHSTSITTTTTSTTSTVSTTTATSSTVATTAVATITTTSTTAAASQGELTSVEQYEMQIIKLLEKYLVIGLIKYIQIHKLWISSKLHEINITACFYFLDLAVVVSYQFCCTVVRDFHCVHLLQARLALLPYPAGSWRR